MSDPVQPARSPFRLPGPSSAGASIMIFFRTKIKEIKVTKLTFKTDHHTMTDNNSDWANTGSLFKKPEWTYGVASKPVSNTKKQRMVVDVEFEVYPLDADETDADITGTSAFGSLVFTASQKFKGGTISVASVRSTAELPDLVQKLTGDIKWSVNTKEDGTFDAGASWGHTVYETMDVPANAPSREAGITQKRMDKSVELVAAAASADPHAIALSIQTKFPGYTLTTNPAVPPQFHHPLYFAVSGQTESGCGAWPAAEYISATAECQAIIRFMRAVMKQVGCPGDMPIMVVWSDPNNSAAVMEGDWDAGAAGLAGTTKVVAGKTWSAVLVDTDPVKVGQLFAPDTIGLNNFEACLKLTAGGRTKYYGGGAGDYDTKEGVITCFQALCWISMVTLKNGDSKIKIEQIVKRY